MYIYKVEETKNYYINYEKAINALRCYIGSNYNMSNVIYDNLDDYYDEKGIINKHVDNIPKIVYQFDDESTKEFTIMRINVRE